VVPRFLVRIVPLEPTCRRDSGLARYRRIPIRRYVEDGRTGLAELFQIAFPELVRVFASLLAIGNDHLGLAGYSCVRGVH